jgi:hypothetical protein
MFRRLAVTVTTVAALAVPAAAQARPDVTPTAQRTVEVTKVDRVSPDARYGEPDGTTKFISVPAAPVVEADEGFDWGAALIGGGAALALTAVLGGTAMTVRPNRTSAQH